jgi:hypothetical protein
MRNPVRDQALEAQIKYYDLGIKRRALTTRLKGCTKGA